jgi:ring-1,2-phenylacetyl-CoA epoxidase subunit PaaC
MNAKNQSANSPSAFNPSAVSQNVHYQSLLRLGDTNLILSHRLSEWTGHGPVLEEDIAMANIALDLLGQARLLLQHAARISGVADLDEDQLAYWRDPAQYRNFTMMELPNSGVASVGSASGDYAFTIVRNALFSAYGLMLWPELLKSRDTQLAAIADKALKEVKYHFRHASDWLIRFGDGTEESQRRAQLALNALLPYCNEWFSADAIDQAGAADGLIPDLASLKEPWSSLIDELLERATLKRPIEKLAADSSPFLTRGKSGQHGEHLSYLLSEMQSVARAFPAATW